MQNATGWITMITLYGAAIQTAIPATPISLKAWTTRQTLSVTIAGRETPVGRHTAADHRYCSKRDCGADRLPADGPSKALVISLGPHFWDTETILDWLRWYDRRNIYDDF
jgi:hypothetical protein